MNSKHLLGNLKETSKNLGVVAYAYDWDKKAMNYLYKKSRFTNKVVPIGMFTLDYTKNWI